MLAGNDKSNETKNNDKSNENDDNNDDEDDDDDEPEHDVDSLGDECARLFAIAFQRNTMVLEYNDKCMNHYFNFNFNFNFFGEKKKIKCCFMIEDQNINYQIMINYHLLKIHQKSLQHF